MQNLLRHAKHLWRKAPLAPLQFPTAGFEVVSENYILEEEQFEEFKTGRYYPVNIGDIFNSKYQVLGKLGFGVTSTVWLARDLL
jgi:serine/threonine-protein kinase SRPK3